MPSVHIYQNKTTQDIVLCPFGFCEELGGGSVATGALIYLSRHEFETRGVEIVRHEFEIFRTRDTSIKSELFEEMTGKQRKQFLAQHKRVTVSQPYQDKPAKLYISPNDDRYGSLAVPFDEATFANCILEALEHAK